MLAIKLPHPFLKIKAIKDGSFTFCLYHHTSISTLLKRLLKSHRACLSSSLYGQILLYSIFLKNTILFHHLVAFFVEETETLVFLFVVVCFLGASGVDLVDALAVGLVAGFLVVVAGALGLATTFLGCSTVFLG